MPANLISVSSNLALIPMVRAPNYCASKAALHHFILTLREQLKGFKVKIVELFPPAVQSKLYALIASRFSWILEARFTENCAAELHDEKHQPDIKNGRSIGIPVEQFTNEAYQGIVEGREEVPVASAQYWYDSFELKRQELFQQLARG